MRFLHDYIARANITLRQSESKAVAALHYAKLGLPVLPMRGIRLLDGSVEKSTYPHRRYGLRNNRFEDH